MSVILGVGVGAVVGAAAVMWLWWKSAEDEAETLRALSGQN